MQTVRLFVATRLPDDLRTALVAVQHEMESALPLRSASWTRGEKLHLTLRFLGDVDSERVDQLASDLAVALTGFGAVDLICERLGCFPDLRFPRVVWAWVHDAQERLTALSDKVNTVVTPYTAKPVEERFTGHITLARPRGIKRAAAETLARFVEAGVTRRFGAWRATEVELVRSERLDMGSRYSTVAVVKLEG